MVISGVRMDRRGGVSCWLIVVMPPRS